MKKTILLIDDEEHILRLLQFVLRPIDAILQVTRSGMEALAYLVKNPVAVALLDYSLPGMMGSRRSSRFARLRRGEISRSSC